MMNRIVLSTRNAGKVEEIRAMLKDLEIEVLTPDDFRDSEEVEENAPTLRGNAEKKAVALFQITGLPTLADDTGLEVDVLNGAPGVHSARYAGPEADPVKNRKRMLEELEGVGNRKARFRTVIAFKRRGADIRFFEGICSGEITREERGAFGFGYDSIFQPEGYGRTFAELTASEKNLISHRGKAVRKAIDFIRNEMTRKRQ